MNLSTKIALLVSLVSLLVGAASVFIISVSENHRIENERLVRAAVLNQAVYEALYASMRNGGDREGNRHTLERLNQVEDIREIRVIHGPAVDRQYGVEMDELPQDELDRRALAGEAGRQILEDEDIRLARFVTPLFITEECLACHQAKIGEVNGAISVSVSLAVVDQERVEHRNLLVSASLVGVVFVGLVIYAGSKRLVVLPISRLQAGVETIASGDLAHRLAATTGEDELAHLTQAFNQMAENLQGTIEALREKSLVLQDRQQQLLTAQRVARMGFLSWDLKTNQVYLSRETRHLFGLDPGTEETSLDALQAAIHPDDQAQVEENLRMAAAGLREYNLNHRILRPDGETLWVHSQAELLVDEEGNPVRLLGTVVDITEFKQASEALQKLNAELEERVQERTHELELRNAVLIATSTSLEFDQVYLAFFEKLRTLVNFDCCSIVTFNHNPKRFKTRVVATREQTWIGTGFEGYLIPTIEWIIAHREFRLDDDLAQVEGEGQVTETLLEEGIRSQLLVPIMNAGKVIGTLNFGAFRPSAFSVSDGERLMPIAAQLGIALENARLYEREKRRSTYLALMNEIGGEMQASLQLDDLLDRAVQAAWRYFGYYNVSVLLLNAPGTHLEPRGVAGVSEEDIPTDITIEVGEGIIGRVAQTGKPYLSNDVYNDPVYIHLPGLETQAELCVPILAAGKVVGVLNVESTQRNAFDELDQLAMGVLADQLAAGISNARLYETMVRLAITDELTCLYNRRYFFDIGEREFLRAVRYQRSLSLVMFDLDHFKRVNDSFGHPVGDQVLAVIADRCRQNIRQTDILARYGGEEFVVLMPETDLEEAETIARRLLACVADTTVETTAGPVPLTISLGIGQIEAGLESLESLVGCADEALYAAKQAGRNRIVFCNELEVDDSQVQSERGE